MKEDRLEDFDVQGERPSYLEDLPKFIHIDDSPHAGGIHKVVEDFLELERNLHLPEVLVSKEMEAYAYFKTHGRGIMLVSAGVVVAGATVSFTLYMRNLYKQRQEKLNSQPKPPASLLPAP